MPIASPKASSADVGLIGLAVMGQNLALNMADHGHKVAVFNRTVEVTERFVTEQLARGFGARGGTLVAAPTLKDFVQSIARPRRIVLLVKAGPATDAVIDGLVPLLEPGDLVVDGGNSFFTDTERREKALAAKGLLFVGSGVSGGEEGARFGPSLMPGGAPAAWKLLEPIWTDIAAKVDDATGKPIPGAAPGKPIGRGTACSVYIGPGGAGHYVKMVHNGIEYADMQLICEAYQLLRSVLGLSVAECAATFARWNQGELDSFLIEVSAAVLAQKDPVTGGPLVDAVLDAAGQKGTGKWTSTSSLDLGVPTPSIVEAVFARYLSAMKDERMAAAKVLSGPKSGAGAGVPVTVDMVRDALYCSKLAAYAQGFQLMAVASRENKWSLDFAAIAQIFRGGCIIRARFLQKITEAFRRNSSLSNLLVDPSFAEVVKNTQGSWRSVVARAALEGVAAPAFSSALAYYDAYRAERLPANLLQAQRDYFGSHTYERVDAPRGKFFHLDWLDPKRPQHEVSGH